MLEVERLERRMLIVEDNAFLAFGLQMLFESQGYLVRAAPSAEAGREVLASYLPELVVLDLMLPGVDGLQLLQEIRAVDRETRVVILTARAEKEVRVRGLKLGADDYITKPFENDELLARVEAQFRRVSRREVAYSFGRIRFETGARRVTIEGKPVTLRPKEFELLLFFVQNPGVTHTRQQLLRSVWGASVLLETRTVDTHVWELRRKLHDTEERHLRTVFKTGYRFEY